MVKLTGFKRFNRRITGEVFEEPKAKYSVDYTPLFNSYNECPFDEVFVLDFLEGERSSSILMDAFLWRCSPEGDEYWRIICAADEYIDDLVNSLEVTEKLQEMLAQYSEWHEQNH